MFVCRIHGARDLRVESMTEPVPGPGQVLLRLGAGGICGSDLHYYQEGRVANFVIREPLIPGHEASATVAAVGPDVTRVKSGDKVALSPSHACGRCEACRAGRENLCRQMFFLGSASVFPHAQGLFREYFVLSERQCYPTTGEATLGELAFAEPLAVALHAVNRAGSLLGKDVLITGAGPIGCLTVIAARFAGAVRILCADVIDRPLETARAVGATGTIRADLTPEALAERRFDVAFEASGSPAALRNCIAAVKRGGVLVQGGFLGIPADRADTLSAERDAGERAGFPHRLPLGDGVRMGGTVPGSTAGGSQAASDRAVPPPGRRGRLRAGRRQVTQRQGPGHGGLRARGRNCGDIFCPQLRRSW